MKCAVPNGDTSTFFCPNIYCPPNATNSEYGNFTASTCTYTKLKTNTTNFACEQRYYCHSTCKNILYNLEDLPSINNITAVKKGDSAFARVVASYACKPGNWVEKDDQFYYSDIYILAGPDISAFDGSSKSPANHLVVSFILSIILIALLSINMIKRPLL